MIFKKIIQVLTIIFGIIGLILFFIPYIKKKILNIGNKTGILISILIILCGVKFNDANHLIKNFIKNTTGKIITAIALAGAVAKFIFLLSITKHMKKAISIMPKKNSTIIVLGCRVYGENPSLMLIERLDAAYKYLLENDESVCIVSGGQGNDENISEAECMYRYLIEKGINKNRIFKEEKSVNTRQNLFFSKEIIEKNNLNNNIAITTNEFHEYRAIKEAKRLGINATAIPGKTVWWLFPTFYLREVYSIIYNH